MIRSTIGDVSSPVEPVALERPHRHLPHLDGLRACLALYVVIAHIELTIWPAGVGNSNWLQKTAFAAMIQGRVAVDWFIVLSGFCLMLPALSRQFSLPGGTVDFYWRRARRILPPYWTALAFSILMGLTVISKPTGTHWDITLPITWRAIASSILLTNDIIDPARINHVFWSIAVEWRIYFLFPLILWLWRRWGGTRATLIVAGSAIASAVSLRHISERLHFLEITLSFIGLFALGAYAAYLSRIVSLRDSARVKGLLTIIALSAGALSIASIAQLLPQRFFARAPIVDACFGLTAATCLAHWALPGRSLPRTVLAWPPLSGIGVFAYSLYLLHGPIIQVCWQTCIRSAHLAGWPALVVLVLLGVPVAVTAAYLFFLAVERPFLNAQKRPPAKAASDGAYRDSLALLAPVLAD